MEQLKDWGQQQLDDQTVEANSGLGQAITYVLRHDDSLIAFCTIESAQIDNNRMEQALKLVIRHRKNALFCVPQQCGSVQQEAGRDVREATDVMEESWPSGVCLQGLASNHPRRHWLKPVVVSAVGKGVPTRHIRYGSRRRVQTNHRSGVESVLDDTKIGGQNSLRDQLIRRPAYWVSGIRRKDGVSSIRARLWNCGNSGFDVKGDGQVKKSKAKSTEANPEDGLAGSSDDAPVMGAERSRWIVPVDASVNSERRMNA